MDLPEIRRFELRGVRTPRWCNVVRRGNVAEWYSARVGEAAEDSEYRPRADASESHASPAKASRRVAAKVRELVDGGYVELLPSGKPAKTPIARDWQRIRNWLLKETPPSMTFPLAPGASVKSIANVEQIIGNPLPDDVRESYRLHNGSQGVYLFPMMGEWLALHSPSRPFMTMPACWQREVEVYEGEDDLKSEPKGPIKTDRHNPRWIPFTNSSSGDCLCIDLDPPAAGARGQIIFFWHEVGAYCHVAGSFAAMIHAFADRLEEGVFAFSDENRQIEMPAAENSNDFFRAVGSRYV